MNRFALVLSYDGSAFNGWQSQAHKNGVQDHVEAALSRVAGELVQVVCAGRTDSGVHATAQIVHFDTAADRKPSAWTRGLNSNLPESIAAQHVMQVAPTFHARFDAQRRRYQYYFYRAKMRQPLLHQRAAWIFQTIDVQKMVDASLALIGTHDFSSFRSSECQAKTPVRVMHSVGIREYGALVCVEFVANGFLHHMIRNLMGALLYVGMGRQQVAWIAELLAVRDRKLAAPTFAPEGLYFSGVDFGADHPVNALSWQAADLPWFAGHGPAANWSSR